ncbi:hypothetical protein CEUSTIGMA_g3897.t1 [Chlamydomonas eustigma]|uniref:Uncharacterized protein n=1 Tax=Chlamydomonas eustigma TaxID=1157962 RepID=A0A250X0N1_9CHLO|nr:hypothetical protein CEUSTIGMA_g3897.t1 [Chlamydomonas eustigma]|eukprot:GAX76452.1 hypothetical protein CEUSTIGMA_g3897.t1 [Chlamydomonas eustigma]
MRGSLIDKERTSDGGTGLLSSNNKPRNNSEGGKGGGTGVVGPKGSALNIHPTGQLPLTTLNNKYKVTINAPHLMAQTLFAGSGLGLLNVPDPLHTSNTSNTPRQRQIHLLASNHIASSNPQEIIENTHQQVISRMQAGGSLLAGSPGLQPIPPSTGRPHTSIVIPGVDTIAGRSPAIQLSSERQGSPQKFTSSSGLKGHDEQDSPKTSGSGGIPYVSRARMKLLESLKVGQSIAAALGRCKEDPGSSSGAKRGISGNIDPRSSDPDLMLGRPSPFARRSRSFSDLNQLINTYAITASAATPTTILELNTTDDIKQPPQARPSSLMQQPPVGGMAHSSNLSLPKKTFGNKKPSVTDPATLNPSSKQDSSSSSAVNQNAIKRRHPGKGTSVTKGDKASQAVSSSLNTRASTTASNEAVHKNIEAIETSPLRGGWKGFNPKQGKVMAQHGRLISKWDSSSGAEMTATGQDKKWKTVQADSEEAMVPDGTRGTAARTRWQQKGLAPIPGGSSTGAFPFLRRSRKEEEEKTEDGVIMLHGSSPTSHHITATLASSLSSGVPSYDNSTSRLSKEVDVVDDSTTSGTFQKLGKIGQEAGIQLLPPAGGSTTGGVPRDAASMLAMYCNRVNTSWVEPRARHWTRPAVVPQVQVKGIHGDEHRRSVADNLRRGGIAFWYLAGEDYVSAVTPPTAFAAVSAKLLASTVGVATGSQTHPGSQESESQIDIWTSDPYALVGKIRPGLLHGHHGAQAQRHAHSCQSRVLGQLSLAVRDLAGTEALAKTHVVLSVNDEQQEEVMKQLWEFKFYARHGGYLYDDEEQRFISPEGEDEDSRLEPTGTGIAAMQLNWHPDAFVMSPEGLMDVLEGTVAELLIHRGVKWMTCYRARDMSLLRGDGILDIGFLSQAFFHRSTAHKSSVVTQVHLSEKLAYARKFGSVVLCHNAGPNTFYNAEVGSLKVRFSAMMINKRISCS